MVLLKKVKMARGAAKVAGGVIVFGAHVLYRPKYVYVNRKLQNKRLRTPCVIIANHTSSRDGPFLMSVLTGTPTTSMIAKEWYENKKLNWLVEGYACIPVDRNGADISWLRQAIQQLKEGKSVIVFPEGFSNDSGKIAVFKPGFALLAHMAGVPILPICLDREYHAVGKRKRVMIGEPQWLTPPESGATQEYFQAEADRFQRMIVQMQTKLDQVNSWI